MDIGGKERPTPEKDYHQQKAQKKPNQKYIKQ